MPDRDDCDARRAFACPPREGELDGIDLALLDPAEPDARRLLIEAEHPELSAAIEAGQATVVSDGVEMSPRAHIAMHEIVANQIWDGQPPETWETAKRLTDLGYDRHEVLHMLASVVAADVFRALTHDQPFDRDDFVTRLRELPDSWEAQRNERAADAPAPGPPLNRAARRARRRRKGPASDRW